MQHPQYLTASQLTARQDRRARSLVRSSAPAQAWRAMELSRCRACLWATCHPPVQYERPSTTPVMAPPYGWIHKMLWFMNPASGRVDAGALHGRGPVWFILMVQGKSDADPSTGPVTKQSCPAQEDHGRNSPATCMSLTLAVTPSLHSGQEAMRPSPLLLDSNT
jgi:hypothetical protein